MSFLVADDHLKLRHWLQHYLVHLGLWANRTHLALRVRAHRTSASDLNVTRAVAASFGIPASAIREVHAPPSDALKLSLMNAHINALPSHEFHVYADVDELHDYPCEMRRSVWSTAAGGTVNAHSSNCIAGHMWDQYVLNTRSATLAPLSILTSMSPTGAAFPSTPRGGACRSLTRSHTTDSSNDGLLPLPPE